MAEITNAARQYYSRAFLNSGKGMAAIEAKTSYWHPNCVSAFFRISDCNRVASLDFDWDNPTERGEKLEKLDMLMSELQKFKEDLLLEN